MINSCFIFILIAFGILINGVIAYKSMTVESGELCSPITKRKIKLGRHEESALRLSQKRLDDHAIDWSFDFKCTFEVHASSNNDGIFAVIQKLILRKNENTNECIDYIQFKRRDGSTSSKYCGYMNKELSMGKHFAPDPFSNNLAPTGNSFVDPGGQLIVTIFVSKVLLFDEETDFLIVFTSYRTCHLGKDISLPCIPEQKDKCIYSGFFNDGYVNCPYPDCVDEGGCSVEETIPSKKSSHGNIVLLSSLSTLAILFCIFVISIYLCRKYSKLCWNQQFAVADVNEVSTNRSTHISGPTPVSTASHSRPCVAPLAPPPEEDKDLPPSYDSLFPDR